MHTPLLIVGAGPFGLAMAAHARERGIDHLVVGEPMSFWRQHMPTGMLLRSGCDWHLDPAERDTLERFLAERGQIPSDVEPLTLDLYLEYADWFQQIKGIEVRRSHVARLDLAGPHFAATLEDGAGVTADRVMLALGFAPFAHVPAELAKLIPADRSLHSRDCVDPGRFRGRRVLIVGGRQSAFETAALLAEAGASAVHVCHRHDTPAFTPSDWSWVGPLLERTGAEPGWYRALPAAEREALDARFWTEGRLKLEPWLGPRVRHDAISIRPNTRIAAADVHDGGLRIGFDDGDTAEVDRVVWATGYRCDLRRVRLLAEGPLLGQIECADGFPVLDESLRTSVPGLFATSLAAARDFGLFFAFTAAVRASARIVARAIERDEPGSRPA